MSGSDLSGLPDESRARLAEIESPETLGASRQLALAPDLFISVAEHHPGPAAEIVRLIREVAARMIDARGESSQAIPNGIRSMLVGLDGQGSRNVDDLRRWIRETIGDHAARQRQDLERLATAGGMVLRDARRIVVYDYSSSVAAVLGALVQARPSVKIAILEARPLDGGAKYLPGLAGTAARVRVLPDSAMAFALSGADAALVGAETLTARGGCFNTIGTQLLAIAARELGVAFYVASTTIKFDVRTGTPTARASPERDLSPILRHDRWPAGIEVDTTCPDLDHTPPELVTGYLTELGLRQPSDMASEADALARFLAQPVS